MFALETIVNELCPTYATFFGTLGCACALIFTVLGSAYGTAKSSIGVSSMGVMKPELIMRGIIPVIFAGIIPIYGIILCIMLVGHFNQPYSLFSSFLDLSAGLTTGFCGLGAGLTIGIAGDAGVRAVAQQPRMYVPMVLILIFGEALGLYGIIISLLLATRSAGYLTTCA